MKQILGLLVMCLSLFCQQAYAAPAGKKLPGDAEDYLPALRIALDTHWPDATPREWFPALLTQESLGKKNAMLKTDRELGCGYGQFTKAYNKDGSIRFDALEETKRLDKSLAGWNWKDCANTTYQTTGLVLKTKSDSRSCTVLMIDNMNSKDCIGGKYNGGSGSVDKRVRFCRATPGCNPTIWEGHLNTQCPQSKKKVEGYGESFCEINSKYPGRIRARMKQFEGKI